MEIYGSELAVHFPTSGLTTHSLTCKQSFHIKVVFTRITRPRKVVLKYHINVLFASEASHPPTGLAKVAEAKVEIMIFVNERL